MGWLIGYGIGLVLVLVACGVVIGDEPSFAGVLEAILISAFWPIVLPIWIGALIRAGMRR